MHDAYLAGFIDGEGCIQVRLRTRSHYTEPHYDIRLQIGQKIVEPLQEVYGGCLTLRSPTTYNRCWLLTWHSRADVLRILTIIEPHLIGKHAQAVEAMAILETLKPFKTPSRSNHKGYL